MKRCTVCKKQYRTGTIVYVASANGTPRVRAVRACSTCAGRAIPFVVADEAPTCKCGAPATTCAGCANEGGSKDRAKAVTGAIKKLKGITKAYAVTAYEKDDDGQYHVAGLEQAITLLEAGDF